MSLTQSSESLRFLGQLLQLSQFVSYKLDGLVHFLDTLGNCPMPLSCIAVCRLFVANPAFWVRQISL